MMAPRPPRHRPLKQRRAARHVLIVALGTCAYLGLPPAAVTALYFTLMAASAVVIARDMRAIYNEGGDEEDGEEKGKSLQDRMNDTLDKGKDKLDQRKEQVINRANSGIKGGGGRPRQ